MRFLNAGDSGLVIEFGNEISENLNRQIKFVTDSLDAAKLAGIIDLIPTYRSILLCFDPLVISAEGIASHVTQIMEHFSGSEKSAGGEAQYAA